MTSAKSPEERQALMADRNKAMHEGMQMMKGTRGAGRMNGVAPMGVATGTGDPKGMPADMAKRQQMLEGRMDMMQTMMEMMMQHLPTAAVPPAAK